MLVYVCCDLDLGDTTLGQGYAMFKVMESSCLEYYEDPNWQYVVIAKVRISGICALWYWP